MMYRLLLLLNIFLFAHSSNVPPLPVPTQSVRVPINSTMTAAWVSTGDKLYVTLTFPSSGYGAIGLATSGMNGTIVACYANLSGTPSCGTHRGPPSRGALPTAATQLETLLNTTTSGPSASMTFSISAAAWGVTAGASQRAIFAIGPFSNATGPQRHTEKTSMALNLCPGVSPPPITNIIHPFDGFTVQYFPGATNFSFSLQYPSFGYGSIGVSPEGMTGTIIICFTNTGVQLCKTYNGYDNGILTAGMEIATASSSSISGDFATTVFTIDAVKFGIIANVSQRVIFATGAVSGNVPQQHAGDTKAAFEINFATGEIVNLQEGQIPLWSWGVVVGVVLLWLIFGWLLRERHFTVRYETIFQILMVFSLIGCGCAIFFGYKAYLGNETNATSVAFGHVASMFFALVLIPTCRHSALAKIVGSAFERAFWLHPTIAFLLLIVMTTHLALMLKAFHDDGNISDLFSWEPKTTEVNALAGFICWIFLVLMTILAILRSKIYYSLFKISHLLFVLVLVFGIIHYNTLAIILAPSVALWILDWVLRIISSFKAQPKIKSLTFFEDAGIVRIDILLKSWEFSQNQRGGGEHLSLQVSSLGPTFPLSPGIHPFSVALFEEETKCATLFIKTGGRWTKGLAALATPNVDKMSIVLQGPYGNLQTPMDRHTTLVFLSGGIGVTPMMRMIQLTALHPEAFPKLQQIWFIWSLRSEPLYRIIDAELSKHLDVLRKRNVDVKVQIYLTTGKPQGILSRISESGPTSRRAIQESVDEDPLLGSPTEFRATNSPTTKALGVTISHERINPKQIFADVTRGVVLLHTTECPSVGVYLCGPTSLTNDAKKAANSSIGDLLLEVHTETFDL